MRSSCHLIAAWFLWLCATARAVPVSERDITRRQTVITDASTIAWNTYDYIIAGGGLAGVVLAARLSEDSSKQVILIEAGYDQENNTDVTDATRYQSTFGTSLDWAYQTVPQTYADSKKQTMRAGRGLGGSTLINGMAWSKPHTFQLDALAQLGNAGVNWTTLSPYMKMAETWTPPTSANAKAGLTYNSACHGNKGNVPVEYDPTVTPNQVEKALNTTIQNLGLPYATDLSCGNPAGGAPMANDRGGNTREDTYRSYLFNVQRDNLIILAGSQVGRVIFSDDPVPYAYGVEFQDSNGNTYQVYCYYEVLLAAGALKTPAILQWSGVGPKAVLQKAGIPLLIELPVGQNLIDQTTTTTDFTFTGTRGGGQDVLYPRFGDIFKGADATTGKSLLQNNLTTWAQQAVTAGAFPNATALNYILDIQADWILNKNVSVSESFDYTYNNVFGYDSWYLLPFGRGYVQVTDNNPYGGVVNINPRYYATQFDLMAQALTAKWTRTVSTTAPLSQYISGETAPGKSVGSSTAAWETWVQKNYRSNWHPIGTVAMMSKSLGGCLDSEHRVYGTAGLRVIDASALPIQQSAHLMSVLYGLAERVAYLINNS